MRTRIAVSSLMGLFLLFVFLAGGTTSVVDFFAAEPVLQNCTQVELRTVTQEKNRSYSYEVLSNSVEQSGDGAKATVVLVNGEDVPGLFEVDYFLATPGGNVAVKMSMEVQGRDTAVFEFFHDKPGELLKGNFEVVPPSQAQKVETVVGKTEPGC